MRTSLIRLVAASAIATLTLTACGSDDGGSDAGGGDGGSDGGGALVGEGTGDDCVIEGTVPIGAALSLTGGAASYGASQKNGLELAAEHLAEKEGVTYELTIEDDATDPKQGISVFEGFAGDGTSLIIGPTLSNGAFQAQPIAQEEGVPVLAISNTADGITAQGDYIFRDSLTEGQVIPQTVAKAKEVYGLEKVVVMYSNDDAFTESGYDVFASSLEAEGVEVLDTLTFSKADTDFRPLLTDAKAAGPDAIVVSGLIEAAIPLVTQARELGIDLPIIGGNGFNNPLLMSDAGDAAEGVVVGAAWNSASDNPENTAFLEAYEAKYDAQPDQFAAQAYTGLMLVDQAVRTNCSGERDDIRDGLGQLHEVPSVLGTISINDDRDAEHEAVVQVVKDGSFAVLD
ncbi:ABC transporter substrate-binding protein [Ornithinicoccus hortensis]|uniref:Amino acid/amide ABC transporter substrate-binding protein (HAAT family) n=1 Tax=Ornithinicoccus hortensis TaxID=82346 RepID=A0A542YRR9_9MICO|nr:ABC transporter substrate-binding protein [Ornithinicoccus hortensis]TQL50795.1 amino acid/amide ABC transporter substrate-binding protein (HAAT family) [Ornithinicoccus hortensis]